MTLGVIETRLKTRRGLLEFRAPPASVRPCRTPHDPQRGLQQQLHNRTEADHVMILRWCTMNPNR